MKKPTLMAMICLACPFLEGVLRIFGLRLTWAYPDALFLCAALGCLALTICAKENDLPQNTRCSLLLPAFGALGCLWFLLENINRLSIVPTAVILICAWKTARPHLKTLWRKLLAAGMSMIPAGLAVLLGVIGIFLGDFGAKYTAAELPSPDGTLTAVAVEIDEGAMGGSARVEVRRTGGIDLGVLSVGFAPETVWEGSWMPLEKIEVEWLDGTSLSVNGTAISVANP